LSDLIVFTYESEERAGEALAHVASLKQENVQKPLVGVEDAAVIYKNPNGNVKVRQTLESMVKGSNIASGGIWGILIGFLFGGPLFGALLGMGISALFGRNIDIGIDYTFIKSVGNDLKPGNSALFLLVTNTPVQTIADALNQFGGTLYHTSLPQEAEQAFNKAMEDENVKAAVEQAHTTQDS